ncbi:MAG TPA: aminotransferase class IV [Aridibacter sp.]|nr:aminotransferase class IV [Aridibacter sp.]
MSQQITNEFWVCLDGELVEAGSAKITAVSGAVLYGRGVFTTVAVRGGEPFAWPRHAERLARDSIALGLDAVRSEIEELKPVLRELAERNRLLDGKARITIFDPSAPALWGDGSGRSCSTLIQTSKSDPVPGPLSLTLSPYLLNSASPLAGVKTCNYLEPLLAKEEASRRGFDEAIRLNEKGTVAGCCLANLFWVSHETGNLRTPALSTGCLAGTTRGYIIDRTEVEEVEMTPDELRSDAKAVCVTSSVRGVSPVGTVEGFGNLVPVPDSLMSLIPY